MGSGAERGVEKSLECEMVHDVGQSTEWDLQRSQRWSAGQRVGQGIVKSIKYSLGEVLGKLSMINIME